MADDPSLDEVIRLNRCMDRCRENANACFDAWNALFEAGKISPEQTIQGLKFCRTVHDLCTAQCVPTRRHFTDGEKLKFELSADALFGLGTMSAFASAIAFTGGGIELVTTGTALGVGAALIFWTAFEISD